MLCDVSELHSARWFGGQDLPGFIHRASLHAEGIPRSALAGRPVVGIWMAPLLRGGAITVTGGSLAEGFAGAEVLDRDVIAPLGSPLEAEGGIPLVRAAATLLTAR